MVFFPTAIKYNGYVSIPAGSGLEMRRTDGCGDGRRPNRIILLKITAEHQSIQDPSQTLARIAAEANRKPPRSDLRLEVKRDAPGFVRSTPVKISTNTAVQLDPCR